MGAGLPAAARAADAARAPPRPDDRLLPPHSLPGIRPVLAAALAAAGARRAARRGRHRIPAGGGCRQLRPRRAPPAALRDQGVRHHRSRDRRHDAPRAREGVPDLDRRVVVHRARAAPGRPGARAARSARVSATRSASSSASTGSTTPRASATGSRRTASCSTTGSSSVEDVTLVQVASPSRERVEAYIQLRDEIELTVGRINGDFDTMGHTAIRYLHQAYPREEMVALFLAADVMLVTALRDGMNLVAKEYVASRIDNRGVLILSEFAGAADELGTRGADQSARHRRAQGRHHARGRDAARRAGAPHAGAPPAGARAQRRGLVARVPRRPGGLPRTPRRSVTDDRTRAHRRPALHDALARVAASDRLLVALDFDGTLAPLEDEPMDARALPAAARGGRRARCAARHAGRVRVGPEPPRPARDRRARRRLADLLAGSHGAEFWVPGEGAARDR